MFYNIWEEYGFKGNPYSTKALSLHKDSDLHVEKAFVERQNPQESNLLKNLIGSTGGNRLVIEGEVGVGKTTFVNYYRYLAEYKVKKQDRLFTSFGEISFQQHWSVKDFLLNIISHILHKLILVNGLKKVSSYPFLEELLVLDKVYLRYSYQAEGQIFGCGGGLSKNKQISIPKISEARLKFYVEELINFVITEYEYRGVVLHFDNLELLADSNIKNLQQIFQDIRDSLQMDHVYYIFIGQTGLFRKVISPLERVRSIFFGWPIFIPPLTQQEVISALEKRYEIFAMKNVKWTKPLEDDCILFLYNLYNGKIRFIMDAIQAIISRFPVSVGKPLSVKEVSHFLFLFMEEKMTQLLSKKEFQVLMQAASLEKFTNTELAKAISLDTSNTLKIVQKFTQYGFANVVDKKKKSVIYEVSNEVFVLYKNKYYISNKTQTTRKVLTKRQKNIVKLLTKNKKSSIQEVAAALEVSYSTAKKDLEVLVNKEQLQKAKNVRKWVYFLT